MFVLIKSRTKPYGRSRGKIISQIIMKRGQNVCLYEISNEFEKRVMSGQKLGLDQMLNKSCVHSRGHIISPIMIKLDQNNFVAKISNKFENMSCRVKNKVTRSNVR